MAEIIEGVHPTRTELLSVRKRIGKALVEKGWITLQQVDEALQIQQGQSEDRRKKLGEILVDLGYVTEQQVNDYLTEAYAL